MLRTAQLQRTLSERLDVEFTVEFHLDVQQAHPECIEQVKQDMLTAESQERAKLLISSTTAFTDVCRALGVQAAFIAECFELPPPPVAAAFVSVESAASSASSATSARADLDDERETKLGGAQRHAAKLKRVQNIIKDAQLRHARRQTQRSLSKKNVQHPAGQLAPKLDERCALHAKNTIK